MKFTNTVSFLKNNFIFLLNRLTKFYLNYWFVFLVFVPIGVFVFDIDLKQAYGSNVNLIKRSMYDVFGLQGFYSYNITWCRLEGRCSSNRRMEGGDMGCSMSSLSLG